MFPKEQRPNSRDIQYLLKNNNRYVSDFFRLLTFPFPTLRCGVVISKKTIKRRVDRNRQKRRILHVLRSLLPSSYYGYCVVWVHKDTSLLNQEELRESILSLLRKSGIL